MYRCLWGSGAPERWTCASGTSLGTTSRNRPSPGFTTRPKLCSIFNGASTCSRGELPWRRPVRQARRLLQCPPFVIEAPLAIVTSSGSEGFGAGLLAMSCPPGVGGDIDAANPRAGQPASAR